MNLFAEDIQFDLVIKRECTNVTMASEDGEGEEQGNWIDSMVSECNARRDVVGGRWDGMRDDHDYHCKVSSCPLDRACTNCTKTR